jgi:hypothetical protein
MQENCFGGNSAMPDKEDWILTLGQHFPNWSIR